MRKHNTDWGDTVGIFRKVTQTSDSSGMACPHHFAGLHDSAGKHDG